MTLNLARSQQLRDEVLSKLHLPTSDRTQELVISLRTFLYNKSRVTREELRKSKPEKRKRLAQDFLHSQASSGLTQQNHFWPASEKKISDSQIIQYLTDFMFLDVDKIPRHLPEGLQSASTAETSQGTQQDSLAMEFDAATKAAEEQMERLDKQDPTYTEEANGSTTKSNSNRTALTQPPSSVAGLTPYERVVAKVRKSNNAQLNSPTPRESEQIKTPPPSEKRAGKRRALPLDSPDNLSVARPAHTGLFPVVHPKYGEPAPKKARFDRSNYESSSSAAPTSLAKPQHTAQVGRTPEESRSSSSLVRPNGRPSTPRVSRPIQEDPSSSRVTPPRVDFDSFGPPTPSETAVDREAALPTASGGNGLRDRIVIDFEDIEPSGLFGLPSLFLDQLAERRKAHEGSSTNESRVRALVLGAIEVDLRRKWKGA